MSKLKNKVHITLQVNVHNKTEHISNCSLSLIHFLPGIIYLFVWSSSIAEIHQYRLDVCWWLSFKTSAWNIYSVSTACVGACVCVWVCASKWPSVCSCMDLCLSMLIKPTDIAVSLLCWFRLKANCSNILPNLLSPSIYIFPSVSLLSHHPYLSASAPLSPLSSYTVCASGHLSKWLSLFCLN